MSTQRSSAYARLLSPALAAAVLICAAPAAAKRSNDGASTAPSTAAPVQGSPAGHLGERVLRKGMSGEDVRDLQRSLTALGFHTAVRGKFDTLTAKQVRALQRSAKRRATGVVDGGTARFIANVLAAEGTGGIVAQLPDSGGRGGAGQGDSAPADAGPQPLAPGSRARLTSDGLAQAPADAPAEVQAIIAAGNKIAHLPYRYGGGHGSFNDSAYDCSGSVSFGLHGAGLLRSPEDSTGLESFGSDGAGQWVTIYANSGHTFMVVAGLRFDTSGASQTGSRWQRAQRSSSGYTVRHPDGL